MQEPSDSRKDDATSGRGAGGIQEEEDMENGLLVVGVAKRECPVGSGNRDMTRVRRICGGGEDQEEMKDRSEKEEKEEDECERESPVREEVVNTEDMEEDEDLSMDTVVREEMKVVGKTLEKEEYREEEECNTVVEKMKGMAGNILEEEGSKERCFAGEEIEVVENDLEESKGKDEGSKERRIERKKTEGRGRNVLKE